LSFSTNLSIYQPSVEQGIHTLDMINLM